MTNRRGRRAHFGSARKLTMQKLFMMTPDMPNEHMQRGIETEDLHRIKFMKLWNATRDGRAYDGLTAARGRFDFLRYSPDDVVTIAGRRVLVDFKSPNKVADEEDYDFDYQCQINLGADILNLIGMPAQHGLLSRLSWAEWKCVGVWVDVNAQLQDEIVDCAHHYWTKHVLTGEPPPFVGTPKAAEFGEEAKAALRLLSAQVVAIDEVERKLNEERDKLVATLREIAADSGGGLGTGLVFAHAIKGVQKVNVDHLNDVIESHGLDMDKEAEALGAAVEYDTTRLLDHIKSIDGFDLAPFVKGREINVEKVIHRMQELGVSPDVVLDLAFDIRKSGKKNLGEVNDFKPRFIRVGEEVQKRLTNAALIAMGAVPPETPTAILEEVECDDDEQLLIGV